MRSSFVRILLLDLDSYGGNDPDRMFPLIYKQMARRLAPKLCVIFRHMVKGVFPVCWRLANVVSEPNESSSLDVGNYAPILITPLLSKVFEKIVAGKLSPFLKSNSLLPLSQFLHRRGLANCDALLSMSNHLQVALDRGMEGKLVPLDFSAAFDRVSQCGLLYKLRCICVGRQFLSMVSEFLSDRRQCVWMVMSVRQLM